MFGSEDMILRSNLISAMDLGNRLDYVYMCLYSIFLLMISAKCAVLSKNKYYYTGAMMAPVVT